MRVYACGNERVTERVSSACVCVCVRERERERDSLCFSNYSLHNCTKILKRSVVLHKNHTTCRILMPEGEIRTVCRIPNAKTTRFEVVEF